VPLIRIYACATCGTGVRADFDAPVPLHCGVPATWRQTRDFKPEEHGWATGEKSAAIGFRHTKPWVVPLEGNGPNGQREVSSLREIRHIESEARKKAEDGVGEEIRFRAFNNDTVNGGMLKNSFGEAPRHTPKLTDARGRQKISFEVVEGDPVEVDTAEDVPMGPGAAEALASALGPGMSE
jgi:hypothetical protein